MRPSPHLVRTLLAAALLQVTCFACADFKGASAAAPSDASTEVNAPPGTGPGPRGALPSGFCCTSDADCRYRHCLEINGSQRCSDECTQSGFCQGGAVTWTCDILDGGDRGQCQPAAGDTAACVPPSQFTYGTRMLGDCCAFGTDGKAGWECEGALCTATDNNPFVCSQYCDTYADCPGPYDCVALGNYRACVPANSPYTCN
jgi:hypothetical protein